MRDYTFLLRLLRQLASPDPTVRHQADWGALADHPEQVQAEARAAIATAGPASVLWVTRAASPDQGSCARVVVEGNGLTGLITANIAGTDPVATIQLDPQPPAPNEPETVRVPVVAAVDTNGEGIEGTA